MFGVTGAPRTAGEVDEIAAVMNQASQSLPALRLVVIGRGATEARKGIETALAGSGVEIVVRGVVPAEEVADEFARADVLLFVRGAITLQRGSAIAGVACGLPIVGYRVGERRCSRRSGNRVVAVARSEEPGARAGARFERFGALDGAARAQLAGPAGSFFLDANRGTLSSVAIAMRERPLRVLIVASHPVQYESPILRLLEQDSRVESEVAYCSLQGAESGVDPEFGVEVKWDIPLLDGYKWTLIRNRSWAPRIGSFFGLLNMGIWRKIRRGNFDAVVVLTGYVYATFWIALAAAKLSGVPVLFGTDATGLQPRDGRRWKVPIKRLLLPLIFRLADIVIITSEAGRQFVLSLGIADSRIVLRPFVVDNMWWRQRAAEANRSAVRREWVIPEDAPVVLFCAKLQPWKRPDDVLRAFAKANVEGAYLVLAGDGPLRGNLEAAARSLGVAERTRFLGFVNQTGLPSVYRSADLFVLPSKYDACPVVVCEAMLCGCPVVLSDEIRGRFDLVNEGRTGFIYPCGNIDVLAGILGSVLRDGTKLAELGRAAILRMETWSPRENVDALVLAVERARAGRP